MGSLYIDAATGNYVRKETAVRGEFMTVSLPNGQQPDGQSRPNPDFAVQTDGNLPFGETDGPNLADRQKGLIITTDDPDDELTIYVLNDELRTADASIAFNIPTHEIIPILYFLLARELGIRSNF